MRVRRLQSAYYLATGVWPLLHRRSFEAVTGKKEDFWLAQTVGVITTAVGLSLAVGDPRRESPEQRVLAVASAGGFAAVDLVYGLKGRISPVYLVDAVLQIGLLAAYGRQETDPSA